MNTIRHEWYGDDTLSICANCGLKLRPGEYRRQGGLWVPRGSALPACNPAATVLATSRHDLAEHIRGQADDEPEPGLPVSLPNDDDAMNPQRPE